MAITRKEWESLGPGDEVHLGKDIIHVKDFYDPEEGLLIYDPSTSVEDKYHWMELADDWRNGTESWTTRQDPSVLLSLVEERLKEEQWDETR